jgi:glycosyltransferase involved in cell wall biosynthesis
MRRVAWLGHDSASGGDGLITYSRVAVAGLRGRGVDVRFLHHDERCASSSSMALPAVGLAHRALLETHGASQRVEAILREHGTEVVHVSLSFSSLDFALPRLCRRLDVPLVATLHVPFDRRRSLWSSVSGAVYRGYARMLARCDAVIVFSAAQRDLLTRLGVPEPVVHVLPNGVDVTRYQPGPSDVRNQLDASRIFSYVGRLDPEKNVGALLEAFCAVSRRPDVRMVVVGDGAQGRRLKRRFADPRVVFTGLVTDEQRRIDVLRASDAFFLPSSVEGLSLAMLEAMACGAATVATDVGGDGEALRGAGIVLDPERLRGELRSAIRLLVESPDICQLLGEAARTRAVQRFDIAANLDRLLALYGALTAGHDVRAATAAVAGRA